MLPPPDARPHSDGVAAALATAAVPTGRGKAPDGAGWQGEPGASTFVGYAVLWPTPGAGPDPDERCLNEPYQSLVYSFQLTCVGATQQHAEAVGDTAKAALTGRRVPVDGRSTHPTRLDTDRPASRDDATAPPVHFTVLQMRLTSDPG